MGGFPETVNDPRKTRNKKVQPRNYTCLATDQVDAGS